jgi:hypothetical protein
MSFLRYFAHPGGHPHVRNLPWRWRTAVIRRAGVVAPSLVAVAVSIVAFGALMIGLSAIDAAWKQSTSDAVEGLRGLGVMLGFWIGVAGTAVAGEAARRFIINRALDRMTARPCPGCGYDLTGLSLDSPTCPECGWSAAN